MVRGWLSRRGWGGVLKSHSLTVPVPMLTSPPMLVPTARVVPLGLNASDHRPLSQAAGYPSLTLSMVKGWLSRRGWAGLLRLHKVTVSPRPSPLAPTARVLPSGLNATDSTVLLWPATRGWLMSWRGGAGSLTFHRVTVLALKPKLSAAARVLPSGLNVSEYTSLTVEDGSPAVPMVRGGLIWRGWAGSLTFHKMTVPVPSAEPTAAA